MPGISIAGPEPQPSECRPRMKNTPAREILQRIQGIVARETGKPLGPAAERELKGLLDGADGAARTSEFGRGFHDREVTILLADVRGFTAIAESHPADTIIQILNGCLGRMTEIAFRHQGTIDKFMGDSIMVLFGAPESRPDDVQRALACAVEMQLAMHEINLAHRERGLPEMFLGIGMSTGHVLAGMLGSERHSEYTVIGDEVNMASRIVALSLRGQVLISQGTYDRCEGFAETGEPMDIHVKGKSRAVNLREVVAIPSLGLKVPRLELRRSHRVPVELPLRYHLIVDGIVLPESHPGTIRDIGYGGVLLEVDRELPMYSEVKLDFDLPLIAQSVRDIYARTVFRKSGEGCLLYGTEFTSVSKAASADIELYVQLHVLTGATR
jgi:adenylate cyclase